MPGKTVGRLEAIRQRLAAGCLHCGLDRAVRNPSGYCDHLYFPDNCERCQELQALVSDLLQLVEAGEQVVKTAETVRNWYAAWPGTETMDLHPGKRLIKALETYATAWEGTDG